MYALPWWLILLSTLALLLAAGGLGYRLGRRNRAATSEDRNQANSLSAALLALLGLLLGFSYSIVEGRFAQRKALIVDEGTAIEATYLRAAAVPLPYGPLIQKDLREYVTLRVPKSMEEVQVTVEVSRKLHARMWAQAAAMARQEPSSEVVALFLDSLNQLIELHERRVAVGLYSRLPPQNMLAIYVVALLSLLVLGYAFGLAGTRSLVPTIALVAAISTVIVLIVQLDRPSARLMEITRKVMRDVQSQMDVQAAEDIRLSPQR